MDIGSQESKNTKADGSWIPGTPCMPMPPKPHVIHTDRQGNPDLTNWYAPECFPPGLIPTSSARIVGKFVSNNCNYATAAKAQDSVPSNNVPPCRNFPADNAAFWNKIPFASLLALADAASEKAMGSNPLWNKDCPFPANPQININYMPVTQRRIADAFSSSISSQFAPLTPEKSIRTESRWVKDMQYSCVETTNEERNEQENGTTGARVADKVLEIGKEIQKQVTTSLLEAASSMPKEDQGIDNAGNHATELNKTPQQKPRRKKHRPKVITEGKPRTRKMTNPKTDSSKENPTAKRNYVQKNALNITTPAPTAQATEESMNHKMNELADSKGMSTGKRKNERKKILLNKASITSPDEATVEPTDPTRTVAFEGTPTGEPMSWQRKALKKALIASLPKENEENQGGQKQIERRNSVNKTAGSMDQKIAEAARKTCRRALNLDMEGQPKHGSSRCELRENQGSEPRASLSTEEDESSSIIHLGIGVEVIVRNSNNGFGFDFTNSVNKMQKDCMSLPRRGAPSASVLAKTTTGHRENWEVNYQNHTRANYQKTAPILQKNTSVLESPLGTHSSQVSADGSNCSTVTDLTGEAQAKPLKRKNSLSFAQADSHSTNSGGIHYNKLVAYQNLVQFPQSYKKKRTEKATSTSFSGAMKDIRLELAPQKNFEASTSTFNCQISALHCDTDGLLNATRDSETTFQPNLSSRSRRSTKRRSRSSRGLDFASPSKTVSQSYPTEGILVDCHIQQLDNFRPNTSIEVLVAEMHATMTKKKRTKKRVSVVPMATSTASEEKPQGTLMLFNQNQFSANSLGAHPEFMWKQMFSVDEIANQFNCLDINRESSERDIKELSALIPYNIRHLNQQELVLYKRDGTIVPFEHIKKRRPRSKVELDEETNKVWKLLMESINSEGIDGTDEEKARWWKEEREVFRGRANSFIARMHLVQGDRRFSQWKGSVVDSVIGVFLTQNVADHLSSSAFMSLAAHFPLKSNQPSYEEITSSEIDKPINCMHDPDSNTNWSRQMPSESSCETFSVALHDTVFDEEREVADSDDSLGSSTGSLSSRTGLDKCHDLMVNGSTTTTERGEHDFVKEHRREIIDVLLSPNSLDSSISQTTKIKESNSEISSATDGFKINFQNNCSFVELLQKASSTMHNGIYSQGNGILRTDNFEMTDINNPPISAEEAQNYPTPNVVLGDENSSNQSQSKLLKDAKTNDIPSAQSHKAGLQPGFSGALDIEESSIAADKLDNSPPKSAGSCLIGQHPLESKELKINDAKRKAKSRRVGNEIKDNIDWDALRKQAEANSMNRERSASTMDSLDWEAIRCADVDEIANTIKERGMNNVLAKRIKDFLNRLVQEHGSIDLEWLRDVPPDKAKEYLLSIRGLGLKSVECVRLLTLHHLAFPVDTNVGRIAVRLGWVPLQPLPESLQLHLLELYPVLESIQKYLWPRLCKLDQRTLYELHYQMITFGKVFCTKSKPNCNACPMRGECRHFASAFASAQLALPGLEQTGMVSAAENRSANQNPAAPIERLPLPLPHASECPEGNEVPQANWKARAGVIDCVPIVEEPASPEPEGGQILENDIEDSFYEDPDEIPTIKLNIEEFNQNLQNYIQQNMELQESDMSKALVALTAESASIPMPKLKNVSRLRTEHQVYELPDSHPLVQGLDRREPDDPCSYLLAIWTPGEMADSIAPPELRCSSQESGKLCDEKTCFSCNSVREANSHIVRGTLLIPCRTAMRGSFPLNGTYFQVNEVFADHDSSLNPIHVPREWIWNLPRRTVYFGTSIPTIFKGLTTEGIQHCFWRGYVCVRGFDQTTRAPRPLMARLHFPASKLTRGRNGENK